MMNFYKFHTGVLDNQNYAPLIDRLRNGIYTKDMSIIEHIIKKEPIYVVRYAFMALGGRWKEAEHIIMKDPVCAYQYAMYVVQGRWRDVEPIMLTYAFTALCYAKDIMKSRWPEAEDIIKTDPGYWVMYCQAFGL